LPIEESTEPDVESRSEQVPRAASIAVRFAIALQQPTSDLRLDLGRRLSRYCTRRGYGLWLADVRPGFRAGNWFQISPQDRERLHEHFATSIERVGKYDPEFALPITLVGPARVGSTHALLAFLRQYRRAGVLACSVTVLDDLAFIHVQLAVVGIGKARPREELSDLLDVCAGDGSPWAALPSVLKVILGEELESRNHELDTLLMEKAGDYQTFVGPILDVAVDEGRRIAFWISWRWQGSDSDMSIPLLALRSALRRLQIWVDGGVVPNIDYLVCRQIGDSELRAKGKISLPWDVVDTLFPDTELELGPSRFSVSLEDAWRAALHDLGSAGLSEVTVSWREIWLGHWASPV
jgi:hypothetical protein